MKGMIINDISKISNIIKRVNELCIILCNGICKTVATVYEISIVTLHFVFFKTKIKLKIIYILK